MNIGYKIKQRRKELDLTQVELGKKVHKSSQVISNWETRYITCIVSDDLQQLSTALSVPVEYFVPGGTEKLIRTPPTDPRLEELIKEYSNLDEQSKDLIDAIITIHKKHK